jgi:hypothetical protein
LHTVNPLKNVDSWKFCYIDLRRRGLCRVEELLRWAGCLVGRGRLDSFAVMSRFVFVSYGGRPNLGSMPGVEIVAYDGSGGMIVVVGSMLEGGASSPSHCLPG